MSIARKLTTLAAIATATAAFGAVPAAAMAAAPAQPTADSGDFTIQTTVTSGGVNTSPTGCTFGSSGGNVQTCFQIVGPGGTSVDYMRASMCVFDSTRILRQEFVGPSFTKGLFTGKFTISPPPANNCIISTLPIPDGTVDPGNYTAITWRFNSNDNTFTNIGQVTWGVG
jgi:hypothetical protein